MTVPWLDHGHIGHIVTHPMGAERFNRGSSMLGTSSESIQWNMVPVSSLSASPEKGRETREESWSHRILAGMVEAGVR